MIIYCISDIHGHLDALKEALTHIDLSGTNRLALLGDYIDYGEQSGQTLRYIYDLQQQYGPDKVIVLRGNHEEDLLEWLKTFDEHYTGGPDKYGMVPWSEWLDFDRGFRTLRTLVSPEQFSIFQKDLPTLSDVSRNIEAARMVMEHDRELISWLRELPYFYETERQILVHAGIDEEAGEWWPWVTPESVFVGKHPATIGSFYKDIIAGHVGTCRLVGDSAYHGVYFDGQSHYYIDGSGRLNILAWDEENGYRQWSDGWRKVWNRRRYDH